MRSFELFSGQFDKFERVVFHPPPKDPSFGLWIKTTSWLLIFAELAIGRALMSDPKYLLLDEPSLGLAPKLVEQISELIVEINSQGVTVLLVEQNANMALKISSHGYIMETGNIVMDNPSEKLMKDKDVQEFYLGLNAEGTERKSFKDVKHYKRKKRWLSWVR